jgi:hypothetical protein
MCGLCLELSLSILKHYDAPGFHIPLIEKPYESGQNAVKVGEMPKICMSDVSSHVSEGLGVALP